MDTILMLVDFDNLHYRQGSLDIFNRIDSIIRKIDSQILINYKRIEVRLYGGWYDLNGITKLSQDIIAEIRGYYPAVIRILHNDFLYNLILNVELAFGTSLEPNYRYLNTFRIRGRQYGLKCKTQGELACHSEICSSRILYDILDKGETSNKYCTHSTSDILYKAEQKLVDSIIVLDLLFYSQSGNKYADIIIVSSDDDIWPGIRSAMFFGSRVIHVQTKHKASSNSYPYGFESLYTLVPV